MNNKGVRLEKPSLFLLLGELRASLEFGLTLASAAAQLTARRGDGHPVLVLPAFLASDASTALLRAYLSHMNYRAYPWRLGATLAASIGCGATSGRESPIFTE